MYGSRVAIELRRRGYDVLATQERPELRGRPDSDILAVATGEQRAVVTENVADFIRLFDLVASADEHHAGIVLVSGRRFPRTPARIADLVQALAALLDAHPGDHGLRDDRLWL